MLLCMRNVIVDSSPRLLDNIKVRYISYSTLIKEVFNMKKLVLLAVAGAFLLLTGCTSISVRNPTPLDEVPNLSALEQQYLIQVGDFVRITVHNLEDPANDQITEAPVRTDGRISLPLIQGEQMLAGYTPEAVRDNLTKAYREFIRTPIVSVNIVTFAPRKIYIAGEIIATPAPIDYDRDFTVLNAVASVGYHHFRADLERVTIIRPQGHGQVPLVMVVNLVQAVENRDPTQNIALLPSDVVIVPKKGIAVANDWIRSHVTEMLPVPGLAALYLGAHL